MLGGNVAVGGALSVDTISENTSATGVTIDSVLLKDGYAGVYKSDGTYWTQTVTAAAGNSQATAAELTMGINRVGGADGTKGVVLFSVAASAHCLVLNNSASNLLIYPASGDYLAVIGGPNLPITIAGRHAIEFWGLDSNWWTYITS